MTDAQDRKLAALLFSDIKGYSSQMDRDEEGALRKLAIHNAIFDRQVDAHGGRTIKTVGDAYMVEFPSAVNAVRCGLDVQRELQEHNRSKVDEDQILVRMGIHFGDVIIRGDDLFGETVNIAARLEPKAPPGALCISQGVYNQVRRKCEARAEDMGEVELKNIKEPFQLYALFPDKETLDLAPEAVPKMKRLPTPVVDSGRSYGVIGMVMGAIALAASVVFYIAGGAEVPAPAPITPGGADATTTEPKPAPKPVTPVRGGTLRLGVEGQRTTNYDLTTRVGSVNWQVLALIYDSLLRYDPEADALMPGVIEKWQTSDDAKQVTLHLRKGVWFHPHRCMPDGKAREATPKDVVFSIERGARDQSIPLVGVDAFLAGKTDTIEGVKILKSGAVQLTLDKPTAFAIHNIAGDRFYPAELKTCDKIDLTSIAKPPGSGPFKVGDNKPGFHFHLERFDRYWDKAPDGKSYPYVDAIDISVVRDLVTSVSRLAKGALDAVEVPSDVADTILDGLDTDRPKLKKRFPKATLNIAAAYPPVNKRVLQSIFFLPGEGRPQLKEEVRQAFHAAIDTEKLATLFKGMATPMRRFLDSDMEGYDEGLRIRAHDSAEAKRLLTKGGYPEGIEELTFGHYKELLGVARALRTQMAEAGIKMRLVQFSPSSMSSAIRSRSVDCFLARWRSPTTNQEPYPFMPGLGSVATSMGWKDDAQKKLADAIMAKPKRTGRSTAYREMEAHLLKTMYVVPLARPSKRAPKAFWLTRPEVDGLTDQFTGRVKQTRGELLQYLFLKK